MTKETALADEAQELQNMVGTAPTDCQVIRSSLHQVHV